nr:hypothetical protein BaRGS_034882 [Batillaria attramentaria]
MGYLWDDIPDVNEGLLELLTILWWIYQVFQSPFHFYPNMFDWAEVWHHMLLNNVVPVAHSVQAVVDEDKISVASGTIIEV